MFFSGAFAAENVSETPNKLSSISPSPSISHYRAVAPTILGGKKLSNVTQTIQDAQGFMWIVDSTGLMRFDGYDIEVFELDMSFSKSHWSKPLLFLDDDGAFWAANSSLHKFNYEKEFFEPITSVQIHSIVSVIDDGVGNLWLGDDQFGIKIFNKREGRIVDTQLEKQSKDIPQNIYTMEYDKNNQIIWIGSEKGLMRLDIKSQKILKVATPLDKKISRTVFRSMAIENDGQTLWVAGSKGLLKVNTQTYAVKHYIAGENDKKSLAITDTTYVFVDSKENVWVGLEKKGLALYSPDNDGFIHLESAYNKKNSIPLATVENINEDKNGSLWLSMNSYGPIRITPDLEKFRVLEKEITNDMENYFPHSQEMIKVKNGTIWIATDGGGINIYDPIKKSIKNIRHNTKNLKTLSSDSVIALAEDEYGYIWAGFWGGGMCKINPETYEVKRYLNDPAKSPKKNIAGDNVFDIEPDGKGGLWISVWGVGIQYFDIKNEKFTLHSKKTTDIDDGIENLFVSDIVLHNENIWLVGSSGLEKFDLKKNKFETFLQGHNYNMNALHIESYSDFYIANLNSFIRFNPITREVRNFTTSDGISDNKVSYIGKDSNKNLWLGTGNGISKFDFETETFQNFYEEEGLAGAQSSMYGSALAVGNQIYFSSKNGVTIVDSNDLPMNSYAPPTVLTKVNAYSDEIYDQKKSKDMELKNLKLVNNAEFPHNINNIEFKFSSLGYVYPEKNKYKYRLLGWELGFKEKGANERSARYTNLEPGTYKFEVYGSNNRGVWDNKGVIYSFKILKPWWTTWLFRVALLCLLFILIYFFIKWRLRTNRIREKELTLLVEDKTKELIQANKEVEQKAVELKKTSDLLSKLNLELEERVEKRTKELSIEVEERKLVESKLFHMAFHDGLTGLPNRPWLLKKLNSFSQRTKHDNDFTYGLMFLDGDRFKQINDTHGHMIGDQLLIDAAMRLTHLLCDNQSAVRLGGDEFTIIVENPNGVEELSELAEKIINEFKKPFSLGKNTIYFNVSIGVVLCDYRYLKTASILRDADIAMYRAKESGKGNYKIFDQEMRTSTLELAEIEADLHLAIENKEFFLVYQPILNLQTDIIVGFEALIRWKHPVKGIISPAVFIPIAEESGIIFDIGQWVLEQACEQMHEWHSMSFPVKPVVSVNLSSNQLRHANFIDVIDNILEEKKVDSKFLKLELTESILIDNTETIHALLEDFGKRNIDLAIDDFGTGYSSLSYLNELPVQYIKIDRKFVDAIDNTPNGEVNNDALEIVRATISLGQSLRMMVIAEGIETQTQFQALKENNCDFGQGYYISKPLDVKDATNVLKVPPEKKDKNAVHSDSNMLDRYQKAIQKRQVRSLSKK